MRQSNHRPDAEMLHRAESEGLGVTSTILPEYRTDASTDDMGRSLLDAHDAILKARLKQTVGANKKRRVCPFVTGDLVYVEVYWAIPHFGRLRK